MRARTHVILVVGVDEDLEGEFAHRIVGVDIGEREAQPLVADTLKLEAEALAVELAALVELVELARHLAERGLAARLALRHERAALGELLREALRLGRQTALLRR